MGILYFISKENIDYLLNFLSFANMVKFRMYCSISSWYITFLCPLLTCWSLTRYLYHGVHYISLSFANIENVLLNIFITVCITFLCPLVTVWWHAEGWLNNFITVCITVGSVLPYGIHYITVTTSWISVTMGYITSQVESMLPWDTIHSLVTAATSWFLPLGPITKD